MNVLISTCAGRGPWLAEMERYENCTKGKLINGVGAEFHSCLAGRIKVPAGNAIIENLCFYH